MCAPPPSSPSHTYHIVTLCTGQRRHDHQRGRRYRHDARAGTYSPTPSSLRPANLPPPQLIEHTKTWRDSWVEILSAETRVADTFLDVYQTIPTTSTTLVAVEETDPETLARVESLRAAYEDLKRDMGGEVARVETLLVAPMGDIRNALKPVRKVIEKREGKKLDYERFLKAVDGGKAKKAKWVG